MSEQWKPGDVAHVRYGSVDQLAIVRPRKAAYREALEFAYVSGGFDMVDDLPHDAVVRRLVTLETGNPNVWSHAVEALRNITSAPSLWSLADQIEAQTRPPKPPEPQGLGAVVEDSEGGRWVRACGTDCADAPDDCSPWILWNSDEASQYDAIDAVRVLQEGLS